MHVLWLRFLTEINAHTQEAPAEMLENPEVSQALKIVEEAAYTPAEMRAYNKFWDNVSVAKTLEYARRQEHEDAQRKFAEAEARMEQANAQIEQANAQMEQANAQIEQANAQIEQANARIEQAEAKAEQAEAKLKSAALKLKVMGLSAEQIAAATGLALEQIESL